MLGEGEYLQEGQRERSIWYSAERGRRGGAHRRRRERTKERETRRKVEEREDADEDLAMMRTRLLTLLWSVVAPSLPFEAVTLAKVVEEARTCCDVLVERKRLRDSTRDKWAERVCSSSVVEGEDDEVELEEEEETETEDEDEDEEGRRQGPLKGATRATRVEVVTRRISCMMISVASEVMMMVISTEPARCTSADPWSMWKGTRM